jgi:hypothetical protein
MTKTSTKRRLAREASDGDYTTAENEIIDAIFERIFATVAIRPGYSA